MVDRPELLNFAELERWLDERDINEIECLVPDLAGIARGKILPRERFTAERGMRLPEGTVALSVGGEVPRRGKFLKRRLRVLRRPALHFQVRLPHSQDELLGNFEAAIEEQRADQRLHDVAHDIVALAGAIFARLLTEPN